ncbi:hypothetical protein Q3G72_025059 [Acer saccharum]|nr:hypothetical protein Q3G72_025059 [Acer saccharum]
MFMESVDASAYAKTDDKMFELFSKVVNKVGLTAEVGEPSYRTRQSVRRGSSSRAPRSSLRLVDQDDNEKEECEVEDERERLQHDEAQFDRTIEENYDLGFDKL